MGLKKIHRITIFLILFFLTSIILSISASADGAVYSQMYEPHVGDGIITFGFNFPINLFILSIIAIIFYQKLNYLKNLSITRKQFIKKVLTGALGITFFGALIDEFFVGGPYIKWREHESSWFMDKYGTFGNFDMLSIVLALLLIFISVFLISKYLLKFNKKHSILTGIIFIIFNIISWYTLMSGFEVICLFPLIIISIIVSICILFAISHNINNA